MDLVFKLIPFFSSISNFWLFVLLLFFFSAWIKISTVFGILRIGLGFGGIPSLLIVSALSFALTLFVMSPAMLDISTSLDNKLKELGANSLENLKPAEQSEVLQSISERWLTFMQKNTNQSDLERFSAIAAELNRSNNISPELLVSWRVVAPAFIVSELRKAFTIAFSLCLPLLIVDLVVSTILAAVELGNLDSQIVSLPFKLLLFVTIDGWGLIAGNIVKSYMV